MCGIIGSLHNPITDKVLRSIHHRGPDHQQVFQWKNLGFGHTRLSIVDLSEAGNQPMQTEDGRYCIVFNGEIYNHAKLREELSGISFKGHSDTETILYYLQEKGIEGVKKFNGIFSIGLLDKEEGKLFLMRDPFGVKPLYYYKEGNKLISFASEIRPLFELGCPKVFNQEFLSVFLKLRYVPSPNTLFKNIYKVAPGTLLEIEVESGEILSESRYHQVPETNPKINKNEALEEYDFLLKKAVKRQLMADVPISLLLSGGVDSALLAKLIAEISSDKPKTYTAGYELADNNINELEDARETARVLGLENHEVILKENGFMEKLPELIKAIEEPLGSQSIYPINYLARQINADGIKVTLTGQGVDEPWGGYKRYNVQESIEFFKDIPIPFLEKIGKNTKNDAIRRAINSLGGKDRPARFAESYSLFDDYMLEGLIDKNFIDFRGKGFTAELIGKKISEYGLENKSAINAMMALDARMNLSDDLLLYTDKISMQHSLETRVPFLDLELMEFAESLPHSMKVGLFKNKWLHKKLAEKHLPKEIIYRKKRGFYMPGENWFRGEVGKKMEAMMVENQGLFGDCFHKEKISGYFRLHREKKANYEKQLYLLTTLCIWMTEHFDN